MPSLLVQIDRFVDEHQPGFVECSLVDASGKKHTFIEKSPIVSTEHLFFASEYPKPGLIACQVEQEFLGATGENLVQVNTNLPWHVESVVGETQFVVLKNQVQIEPIA